MLKRIFLKLFAIFILTFVVLALFAIHRSSNFPRDPHVLMDKYYHNKFKNPIAARKALDIILQQSHNDLPAMIELSQWLLAEENYHEAIPLLQRIHQRVPGMSAYTYQLGYAYYQEGYWKKSSVLFQQALLDEPSYLWREKARVGIDAMASFLPFYQDDSAKIVTTVSPQVKVVASSDSKAIVVKKPTGLARFYALLHVRKTHAFSEIQHYLRQHPGDVTALKEAGFLAIVLHRQSLAINYLTRAYAITHDPQLAMQLAYLYNDRQENKIAYRYFQWARYDNSNKTTILNAENAMTTLRGQQTKLLSTPYFGEFFAMPFTQSRFGLTVTQFIERLGVEQKNAWKTRTYIFSQTTSDNQSKSASLGQISQIFEDDVQITGVGTQMSPLKKIPLILYGEMGAAYDLIYRDRPRWRSDFRGGYMYYQEAGKKAAYYDNPRWSLDYYSLYYNNLTYFSRYQNNVIGVAKSHQGIHILQYKSSVVNIYARGIVVYDIQRLFYNNYAELGPGIGLIPSNRYNVEVRYDYIRGTYLPANAIPNPYGKYYNNQLLQLLLYVKI